MHLFLDNTFNSFQSDFLKKNSEMLGCEAFSQQHDLVRLTVADKGAIAFK